MTLFDPRCAALAGEPCPDHGGMPVRGYCPTTTVLNDVRNERREQYRRYGTNDNLQDGTGPNTRWLGPYTGAPANLIEADLRADYEDYEEETGNPTWVHLVREEMAEAFCEDDPARLRDELIQIAALCVAWVEKLDARDLPSEPV